MASDQGMPARERDHLNDLIHRYTRSLQLLEQQAASFGIHCPVYIMIEIDETREKINDLEYKLQHGLIEDVAQGEVLLDAVNNNIRSVQRSLREVRTEERRVYRLFGIPIWSVSITVMQTVQMIAPLLCIGSLLATGALVTMRLAGVHPWQGSDPSPVNETNIALGSSPTSITATSVSFTPQTTTPASGETASASETASPSQATSSGEDPTDPSLPPSSVPPPPTTEPPIGTLPPSVVSQPGTDTPVAATEEVATPTSTTTMTSVPVTRTATVTVVLTATLVASPTVSPTSTIASTPTQATLLRWTTLDLAGEPGCVAVQVNGIAASNWLLGVDEYPDLPRQPFDAMNNARICGIVSSQEVTISLYDANDRPVPGGRAVRTQGGARMLARWE